MMMRGGELGSERIVPESWVHESTTPPAPFLNPGELGEMGGPMGYAYQWWIEPGEDGAFEAIGIYGQSIYVNPRTHVVLVQASAWPHPEGGRPEFYEESGLVYTTIAHRCHH